MINSIAPAQYNLYSLDGRFTRAVRVEQDDTVRPTPTVVPDQPTIDRAGRGLVEWRGRVYRAIA